MLDFMFISSAHAENLDTTNVPFKIVLKKLGLKVGLRHLRIQAALSAWLLRQLMDAIHTHFVTLIGKWKIVGG